MNRLKLPSLREIPVFVFQASEGSLVNVSLLVLRISLEFSSEYLHILLFTLRLCHLFLCWYLFCRDEPLVHVWWLRSNSFYRAVPKLLLLIAWSQSLWTTFSHLPVLRRCRSHLLLFLLALLLLLRTSRSILLSISIILCSLASLSQLLPLKLLKELEQRFRLQSMRWSGLFAPRLHLITVKYDDSLTIHVG